MAQDRPVCQNEDAVFRYVNGYAVEFKINNRSTCKLPATFLSIKYWDPCVDSGTAEDDHSNTNLYLQTNGF